MSKNNKIKMIEETVKFAEDLILTSDNKKIIETLSSKILPSLHTAKTYAEVKMFDSPEIKINLSNAAIETSYLTDINPRYAPLYSKIRVLLEEFSKL
ncbi:MAG: hypothetical protein ACJ0G8_06295 [Dehalococcoidia bacterium]|tara:strand:- start:70 stop:360 length:291 start_codon:yes stop_codon:yes gene_type:complete